MDAAELASDIHILQTHVVLAAMKRPELLADDSEVGRHLWLLTTCQSLEEDVGPYATGTYEVPVRHRTRRPATQLTAAERQEGTRLYYDLVMGSDADSVLPEMTAMVLGVAGRLSAASPADHHVAQLLRAYFIDAPATAGRCLQDGITAAFKTVAPHMSTLDAATVLGTCFLFVNNAEEQELKMCAVLVAAIELEVWAATLHHDGLLSNDHAVDAAIVGCVAKLGASRCFADKPYRILQCVGEVLETPTVERWLDGADPSELFCRLRATQQLFTDALDEAVLVPALHGQAAERARLYYAVARLDKATRCTGTFVRYALLAAKDATRHAGVLNSHGCAYVHDLARGFAQTVMARRGLDLLHFLGTGRFRPNNMTLKDVIASIRAALS